MTVIMNTIWGRRVSQVIDRHITSYEMRPRVLDPISTKQCVVLCGNALAVFGYTGTAIVNLSWMDTVLANCLAHRSLETAMIQRSTQHLGRAIHVIVKDLALNLNGRLNSLRSDEHARSADLTISIVGWHLGRRYTPFAWELRRGPQLSKKKRYFQLFYNKVGKVLRCSPNGLWGETLGDPGATVDTALQNLANTSGFSHDDVEIYTKEAIRERSKETNTVGGGCIAIQLDPLDASGHVQVTYYPDSPTGEPPSFLSPWILTPAMICAPALQSTVGHSYSECGKYVQGGFVDPQTNLHVRTRLPAHTVHHGRPLVVSYGTQHRTPPAPLTSK